MPDSVTVAVIGAIAATLGYLGKLGTEGVIEWSDKQLKRRSRLIKMQSLLLASQSVFATQIRLVQSLCFDISKRLPNSPIKLGYDEILRKSFDLDGIMSSDQKAEHGLIRSYTINALRPLNDSMIEWLAADGFYKSSQDELGTALKKLEAHLVLWRAKYLCWIPDNENRALVFLADEKDHGIGFPVGIEALIADRVGGIK